ncbi:hypothetical protein ZWY2020_058599 [Hordeum vulgare]|nr:hypothetical protein ZWY2020_058599 [Hordeum vulgare]
METEMRASSSKRASDAPPKVVDVLAGLLERTTKRGDAVDDVSCLGSAASACGGTRSTYNGTPGFLVTYSYFDRLAAPSPEDGDAAVVMDSYSMHRLLVTSVMVAAKFIGIELMNKCYYKKRPSNGARNRHVDGRILGLIFLLRLRLKGLPRKVCKGFPPWPSSLALVFPRSGKGDVA